jgi:hypothetical protein
MVFASGGGKIEGGLPELGESAILTKWPGAAFV